MDFTEKQLKKEYIYRGKILNLRRDEVELPNGAQAYREVIEHPGGVAIAALTPDNELLVVRQFRYPYAGVLYEIPAGKLERGEDPMQCGIRELSEETGAEAGDMILLSKIYPTPAYCEEIIYVYFTRVSRFAGQHLDRDEFLAVEHLPLDTALEMVANGKINDAKTQIAILKLKYMLDTNRL